ncbi:hypothetical protein F2Q70_00032375 [Brassica cretica]|uniref:Uncharacterized protein n=1 Tax=Brassica cretica TaxID=69181 RepID=A0A8S9H297_BRACR|nr:hypothetical protein F2Q70_00032375 [Brassica cretica]KAF2552183.1 hypothetical protein F2Q68_00036749 [Brassica cretica]
MVTSDDWTKSAMRDGEVVAELLVKLKKAKVRPVLFSCPTLRWGNRQPRSRKEAESARCSPSTPLSWSASSSPSAYLDGHEATIGSSPVGSRSKVRPRLPLSNSIVYVCLNTIKIFIFTTNISRFIASFLLCFPDKTRSV